MDQAANTVSFHVGNRPAETVAGVIELLGRGAFTSPTRSTVPLIDYWREPNARLVELSALFGMLLVPPVDLAFEYPVPVAQGKGRDSFTDLMITSAGAAVAVEAKYNEPRYELVEEWLGTPRSPNREAVLAGWLAYIATATSSPPLPASAVLRVPYQLIHRTASVCAVPRPARAVVYQVFRNTLPDHYVADLRALRRLLPSDAPLTFAALACPAEPLARLPDVFVLPKRSVDTGARVREALQEGPLFTFGETVVYTMAV